MSTDDEKSDQQADAYAYRMGFFRGRPRGRKMLPGQLRKVGTSITLSPADRDFAMRLGRGNLSKGIGEALKRVRTCEALPAELNTAAIAAAAAQRDQDDLPEPGQADDRAFDDGSMSDEDYERAYGPHALRARKRSAFD